MTKPLDERLHKAAKALENKDFEKAEKHYRKALMSSPNNLAANIGFVVLLNRSNRSADALRKLKTLWPKVQSNESISNEIKASILVQIGIAHQQTNNFKEALKAFHASMALAKTKEVEGYIANLQKVLNKPLTINEVIAQARQSHAKGHVDQAGKLYEAALQINADSPDALHGMSLVLRDKGINDKALAFLQQAIILAPDRPDFYNDLGMMFQDRENYTKAITFHKRALSYKNDFLPAMVNLGVAYKRSGNVEEAIKAYQGALQINPNMPEAHNNLGNLLRSQGRVEEARNSLLKALELRPDYPDALYNLNQLQAAAKN